MSNQLLEGESKSRRSLVIFPGALGDFVCFLPALARIAKRDGRPVLLCPAALMPLVAAAGLADSAPLEGAAGAWLFSADPPGEADGTFGGFFRIECFTGYGVPEVLANVRRWAGERGKVHPFRPERTVHLAAHFLARLGEAASDLPEVRLSLPGELFSRAAALLARKGERERLLLIHPGSGGAAKRWSRTGFSRVARRWREEGGDVVVLLGPAESGEAGFWRRQELRTLQGIGLADLAAALSGVDVYLGNDSGPSHLAAAVGCHGVVLFGPTDDRRWRPLSSRVRVLRPGVWSAVGEDAPVEIVDRIVECLRLGSARRSRTEDAVDKVGGRH